MSNDPFSLQRFLDAQQPLYPRIQAELTAGRKQTHWMWFVFPQIAGLGTSPTTRHFALRSMDEAVAYFAHPILGPRLLDCTTLVLNFPNHPLEDIFPYPDNLKFHSSMTLFAAASPDTLLFRSALATFFGNQRDEATLAALGTRS